MQDTSVATSSVVGCNTKEQLGCIFCQTFRNAITYKNGKILYDNGSNTLSFVSFLFNLSKFNHAMSCTEPFQSIMRYVRRLVFAKGVSIEIRSDQ